MMSGGPAPRSTLASRLRITAFPPQALPARSSSTPGSAARPSRPRPAAPPPPRVPPRATFRRRPHRPRATRIPPALPSAPPATCRPTRYSSPTAVSSPLPLRSTSWAAATPPAAPSLRGTAPSRPGASVPVLQVVVEFSALLSRRSRDRPLPPGPSLPSSRALSRHHAPPLPPPIAAPPLSFSTRGPQSKCVLRRPQRRASPRRLDGPRPGAQRRSGGSRRAGTPQVGKAPTPRPGHTVPRPHSRASHPPGEKAGRLSGEKLESAGARSGSAWARSESAFTPVLRRCPPLRLRGPARAPLPS